MVSHHPPTVPAIKSGSGSLSYVTLNGRQRMMADPHRFPSPTERSQVPQIALVHSIGVAAAGGRAAAVVTTDHSGQRTIQGDNVGYL